MTEQQHWTEDQIHAVPRGATVPLPTSGTGHPGAVIIARTAYRAVVAYEHWDELLQLADVASLADILRDVNKLKLQANNLTETLIVQMRDAGASWANIGDALELTRATAKERYLRIKAAEAHGITAAAYAEGIEAEAAEISDRLNREQDER